ncbi:MAG: tetratricopeptide repeat protein [Candidatus Acidiferrum sp.]|jgi:tetratricopeptide (TPR) repeat protein
MNLRKIFCLLGVVLAVSSAVIGQTERDRTAAIASALAAHDFDQALELLQPAIKQAPENAKLWTLQALALSGKGDTKGALGAYQKALKISPEYLPALEGAAQLEYDAGSQNAVPLLKHMLRLRPNDPTSHAMLAVLAYKKGDCAQAVEHFAASGPLLDSQPATREEYCACLLRLEQPEKAISVYQRALELSPEDSDARRQLAAIQLTTERPKEALETLAPLLQKDSPDVKTLELASSAYEAEGNTLLGVTTLRQAIVMDPHDVDLYLDFAVLSIDHQSFQVGIDMVNVGLKAEPKSAPLYVARGVLYVQLAKYEEAENDFDRADQLEPNQGIGSAAQGLEQVQSNDPDRALRTVQSKLASKPNDPYLLYLQADILTQMGQEPGSRNFQTALRSAKKAVALQPTLVPARDVLAKLYLQAGQTQAAIDQCREILKLDPKDQTALYHLIQTLRKTGNTNEIPDLLKRLAELRVEATKKETEHNRHKLVEAGAPSSEPSQP